MKFDSQKHGRRSLRLKEYDYAQPGRSFVTIVTYQRDCLFGEIINEEMQLSEFGRVVEECWRAIPEHFPNVELGAYVVMPNHVHGIIVTTENSSLSVVAQHAAPLRKPNVKPGSLGAIVRSFKSAVTCRLGRECNATGIWQRNYGACPELAEGSISFATTQIGIESTSTLNPTRPAGRKMKKTQ